MKKLIVIAVLAYFGWSYFFQEEVVRLEPGIEVYSEPVQVAKTYRDKFEFKKHEFTPVADIEIEAKVLDREDYYLDRASDISPMDLLLGWKEMSDQQMIDRFSFRQNLRWYYWSSGEVPLDERQIRRRIANMHLIPSREAVAKQLDNVKIGEIIRIRGQLVNVRSKEEKWFWKTSTSRMDKDEGSTEIVWIEAFEVVATGEVTTRYKSLFNTDELSQ